MSEVNFDDFFDPEEGETQSSRSYYIYAHSTNFCFPLENCEDFDFIDPSILQKFQRMNISIEKIQKDLFNFDDKGNIFSNVRLLDIVIFIF